MKPFNRALPIPKTNIRFLCPFCARLGRLDSIAVCTHCAGSYDRCVALYRTIIKERPQHRDKSVAELFEALWEAYKKNESAHQPR